MKKKLWFVAAMAAGLVLSACGGSKDPTKPATPSGDPTPSAQTPSGQPGTPTPSGQTPSGQPGTPTEVTPSGQTPSGQPGTPTEVTPSGTPTPTEATPSGTPTPTELPDFKAGQFTYHGWATALGTKWDPNTWETNADDSLLSYVSEGMVSMVPLDTEKASWQWAYDLAIDVKDVSNEHKDELAKYHVAYDEKAENLEGFIYDIKLNPNSKWEEKVINGTKFGGTIIDADDYIESFKILLDPARKNYRANLYYSGESAVAGGNQYYNGDQQFVYNSAAYSDYAAVMADVEAGKMVYFDAWDFWGAEGYVDENGNECPKYLPVNDEVVYFKPGTDHEDAFSAKEVFDYYGPSAYFDYFTLVTREENWGFGLPYEEVVGMYKVDDFTIRYFCQTALGRDYFLTSLTSSWLVNPELYEALSYEDADTGLKLSKYNTSAENTLSYGPYKMVSYEDEKQVKFTQNENWWGWTKIEGQLVSFTNFLVDGAIQQQYQTTDVIIDVLTQNAAKLAFEKGELNDYTPTAGELPDYSLSSQLYQVDETYTMSFFFDSNLEDLQKMDKDGTNKNGVVLSNHEFRRGFSLAIDRADWVTTTEAYKPAYALMNGLYYYDVYNNPESQYRKTEQAMQAVVDLYGVKYGDGELYETLEEAYESITGYNLAEAQKAFKNACDELVEAGLYVAGEEIKIKVAYKKGALEDSDQAQIAAMNKYLEAARQGSGFGSITLEAVGNLADRYGDVGTRGVYAIGYGAWGGAAFYPFRNLQVYMDPEQYSLHEGRCWDPTTETYTINVKGEDVTMTYQMWSRSLVGDGQFANEDAEVKLTILAELERAFLETYYRIPLAGSTQSFLLGYQQHYYTQEYNIMYDFGGSRLMIYDYNDAEWAAYVASQGGQLNYK